MTGRSPADYEMTSHAASQALHEARELRRRQDDNLRSWRHFVGGTLVLYLSTSVIVVAASGEAEAAGAALMLTGGVILLVIAFLIEMLLTFRWIDGPDTGPLLHELRRQRTPSSVDLHLTGLHRADHASNGNTLLCVKWTAIIQAGVATFMIIQVIVALLGITADQIEDIEPSAAAEPQNLEPSSAAPQP